MDSLPIAFIALPCTGTSLQQKSEACGLNLGRTHWFEIGNFNPEPFGERPSIVMSAAEESLGGSQLNWWKTKGFNAIF